jgi:hypothetical protein
MTWKTWFLPTHSLQQRGVSRDPWSVGASSRQALLALSDRLARGLRHFEPYSQQEVRARLLDDVLPRDPRTAAVHAAAAESGSWMHLLSNDATREHRLGRAACRLPSVVFWYGNGLSPEEIGRRLTPFGERCYGDRAIDAACTAIAALLNSGRERL